MTTDNTIATATATATVTATALAIAFATATQYVLHSAATAPLFGIQSCLA